MAAATNAAAVAAAMDDDEPETRIKLLCSLGKQVEATSRAIDIQKRPDYLDEERFKKAQKTLSKYYTNISMGSTVGLMLLLQIEAILIPLLKTGKSRTVADLYTRYSATGKYIRRIYETDFCLDTNSDGWRYINLVRSMHQRIHKLMNHGDDGGDEVAPTSPTKQQLSLEPPNVWVNQYDMALTQFAFVGLFLLKPRKCAAYRITDDEVADIVYYWRLISYYFGIEERFNIFVYHDDLAKQRKLMSLIWDHQNSLLVAPRNTIGLEMAKGFLLAFEDLAKETTYNVLEHWWSPEVSISGQQQLEPYTTSEYFKSLKFNFYFKVLFRNGTLRSYINGVYKKKFDKFCEKSDKITKKLAKKYPQHVFELEDFREKREASTKSVPVLA